MNFRTTKRDTLIATQLLKAYNSTDFDEDAKKELIKEIRFLIGFDLPKECVDIIKQYLLLPRHIYIAKQRFINECIPRVPVIHMIQFIYMEADCDDYCKKLFTNPHLTKKLLVKNYLKVLEYCSSKEEKEIQPYDCYLNANFDTDFRLESESCLMYHLEDKCNKLICNTFHRKILKYYKSIISDVSIAVKNAKEQFVQFVSSKMFISVIDKSMEHIKTRVCDLFRKYITGEKYKVLIGFEFEELINPKQFSEMISRLGYLNLKDVEQICDYSCVTDELSSIRFLNFPTYVTAQPCIYRYIHSLIPVY